MKYRRMRNSVLAFGVAIAFLLVMVDSGFRYDSLKRELEVLRAQITLMEQKDEGYINLQTVVVGVVEQKFDYWHRILITQKNIDPGKHTRPSWGNAAKQPYSFTLTAQQWIRLPEQDWTYQMFNTCAVVGNDDALRFRNYGEEIDTHDVIFRMKEAPTVGYEKHVGRKTHYRLAYAPGDMDNNMHEWVIENDERILYIPTFNNIESYWRPDYNFTTTNSFLVDPYFTVYANGIIKVTPWCSTGWVGFVLGKHVCKHLDIYGFSEHATEYKRYWSPQLIKVFHSKREEENIMNLFDVLGVIRWRK